MFDSSVRWARCFTYMHSKVAALWIMIDMDLEGEKYEKIWINCFRNEFITLKFEV